MHPRTFADRVGTPARTGIYEREFGLKPDWGTVAKPEPAEAPPHRYEKPRIRVKAISSVADQPVYTVLAIGDHHDSPGQDKGHTRAMGRLAADLRPDAIVAIGDWASLDSLSTHETPGSAKHAEKTTFADDLESLDESLSAFHADLPAGSIPTYITLGNHEARAWTAANADPHRCSDLPHRVEQAFGQYRWHTTEFGDRLHLWGIDFTHIPLNVMGKPLGGEHVERTLATKARCSTVIGHTHRRGLFHPVKTGTGPKMTMLNLGTSMPFGKVAKYARLGMHDWTYGVYMLRIRGGEIISEKFYDMLEVTERYA